MKLSSHMSIHYIYTEIKYFSAISYNSDLSIPNNIPKIGTDIWWYDSVL
jgi:hypothetical protein